MNTLTLTPTTNVIDLRKKVLPATITRANKLANKFFPNHEPITEDYYKDFKEAFDIMAPSFIKENLQVINECIWSFKFDKTFFCVCLNPGLADEDLYFGMCN